jgi:hypothetical protein
MIGAEFHKLLRKAHYFQVVRSPREPRSKGHRRSVAGQFDELSVTSATSEYIKSLIDALPALVKKVIVAKGDTVK